MTFTAKQERFIDEYVVDLNATQAAIRAGYSKHTAKEVGYENLTKPHIAEAIRVKLRTTQERVQLNEAMVIGGLLEIATDPDAADSARVQAWKELGRHLGMFTDNINIQVRSLQEYAVHRAAELGLDESDALAIVEDVNERARRGEL